MEAPATIDEAMNKVNQEYGLRVSWLTWPRAITYAMMTKGVKHALYVNEVWCAGSSAIICLRHRRYPMADLDRRRGETVDPEVLINQKKLPASPQWTAYFTDWNFSPQLADNLFAFTPPQGATKTKFVSLKEMADQQKKTAPVPKKTKKGKGDKS